MPSSIHNESDRLFVMSRSVHLPFANRYLLYKSLSNKLQCGSEHQGTVTASSLLDIIVLLLTLLTADFE